MNRTEIMQGDQYPLTVSLTDAGGAPIPAPAIGEIEVMIGDLRKTLSAGEITYDEKSGNFTVPLTQEETFAMDARAQKVQVRIRSYDGNVIGEDAGILHVRAARSKAVL